MFNLENLTPSAKRELRKFFPTAYWTIGGLCFYWATAITAGLLRPELELDLPIIGKCGSGEAIIFTLTFLWPVLLIAHLLVYGYQRVASKGSLSGQFPGVLGDQETPEQLRLLRVGLFVIFIVWPAFVYTVLAVRSFTHMGIALKVGDAVYIRENPKTILNADGDVVDNYVWYRGWSFLLGRLAVPEELSRKKNPDWRWLHWRDTEPDSKNVEVKFVDAAGKPMEMMVDFPTGKPVTVTLKEPPKTDETKDKEAKPRIPVQIKPKHWPTALPVVQPWWNISSALGFCASVIALLVRAIRRRKS